MKHHVKTTLALMLAIVLGGCGPASSSNTTSESNTPPTFNGVQDEDTINLGMEWNALEGVTVSDLEDGDLTSEIEITSIPALVNNDGVLLPDAQGEYYITYAVTDSDDNTVEAYTTLFVEAPLPTETLYLDYDLSQTSSLSTQNWSLVTVNDAVASLDETGEYLTANITSGSSNVTDVMLVKTGFSLLNAVDYTFEVSAKGTGIITLGVLDKTSDPTVILGHSSQVALITEFTTTKFAYHATGDFSNVDLVIGLGSSVNDGKEVLFQNIRLTSADANSEATILINDDLTTNIEGWHFNAYDGSNVSLTHDVDHLKFNIINYSSFNKPWNINLYRETTLDIKAGVLYRVSFNATTVNDQFYELCIEDYRMDWQVRAGFQNGTIVSGASVVEMLFTASKDLTGVFFKLALGQGTASTNIFTIDDFKVEELSDQIMNDDLARVYSTPSWKTYNVEGGVGTASGLSGDLVYQITTLGTSDWHNKLGFEGLTLTPNAKYRFAFTIKADKVAKANFIVNQQGVWNPLVNTQIEIGTTSTELSFTMDSMLYEAFSGEILFQFGGFSENTAPLTITLEALTIYQII